MPDSQQSKQYAIQILFILTGLVLVLKAFQLQVWDSTYRDKADATAIDRVTLYPSRGAIFDRNQRLLVNNNPVYDVMVTYGRIDQSMDTLKFCGLLGITKESFVKRLNKDWRSNRFSKYLPFVFLKNISAATYAQFQESMYQFPSSW
jgi:penicillin-binding protein 2